MAPHPRTPNGSSQGMLAKATRHPMAVILLAVLVCNVVAFGFFYSVDRSLPRGGVSSATHLEQRLSQHNSDFDLAGRPGQQQDSRQSGQGSQYSIKGGNSKSGKGRRVAAEAGGSGDSGYLLPEPKTPGAIAGVSAADMKRAVQEARQLLIAAQEAGVPGAGTPGVLGNGDPDTDKDTGKDGDAGDGQGDEGDEGEGDNGGDGDQEGDQGGAVEDGAPTQDQVISQHLQSATQKWRERLQHISGTLASLRTGMGRWSSAKTQFGKSPVKHKKKQPVSKAKAADPSVSEPAVTASPTEEWIEIEVPTTMSDPMVTFPDPNVTAKQTDWPIWWFAPFFDRTSFGKEAATLLLGLMRSKLIPEDNIWIGTTQGDCNYGVDESMPRANFDQLDAANQRWNMSISAIAVCHSLPPFWARPKNKWDTCFPCPPVGYTPAITVGRAMAETDIYHPEFVKYCNRMDEVWVPSDFSRDVLATSGVEKDKIRIVPIAVNTTLFDPAKVTAMTLPIGDLVFGKAKRPIKLYVGKENTDGDPPTTAQVLYQPAFQAFVQQSVEELAKTVTDAQENQGQVPKVGATRSSGRGSRAARAGERDTAGAANDADHATGSLADLETRGDAGAVAQAAARSAKELTSRRAAAGGGERNIYDSDFQTRKRQLLATGDEEDFNQEIVTGDSEGEELDPTLTHTHDTQSVGQTTTLDSVQETVDRLARRPARVAPARDPPPGAPPPPPSPRPVLRAAPNEPPFVLLSTFKWEMRKGWDSLLSAYLQEFTYEDNVELYILTKPFLTGGDFMGDMRNWVRDNLKVPENQMDKLPSLYVISKHLSDEEYAALYKASDAFVIATRGEGWGMPISEAMSMELPVVVTNWSGVTGFVDESVGYMVDYDLVKVPSDQPWWFRGARWAQVKVDSLRERLREVVSNRRATLLKGKRARQRMVSLYSPEALAGVLAHEFGRLTNLLRSGKCGGKCHNKTYVAPLGDRSPDYYTGGEPFMGNGGDGGGTVGGFITNGGGGTGGGKLLSGNANNNGLQRLYVQNLMQVDTNSLPLIDMGLSGEDDKGGGRGVVNGQGGGQDSKERREAWEALINNVGAVQEGATSHTSRKGARSRSKTQSTKRRGTSKHTDTTTTTSTTTTTKTDKSGTKYDNDGVPMYVAGQESLTSKRRQQLHSYAENGGAGDAAGAAANAGSGGASGDVQARDMVVVASSGGGLTKAVRSSSGSGQDRDRKVVSDGFEGGPGATDTDREADADSGEQGTDGEQGTGTKAHTDGARGTESRPGFKSVQEERRGIAALTRLQQTAQRAAEELNREVQRQHYKQRRPKHDKQATSQSSTHTDTDTQTQQTQLHTLQQSDSETAAVRDDTGAATQQGRHQSDMQGAGAVASQRVETVGDSEVAVMSEEGVSGGSERVSEGGSAWEAAHRSVSHGQGQTHSKTVIGDEARVKQHRAASRQDADR